MENSPPTANRLTFCRGGSAYEGSLKRVQKKLLKVYQEPDGKCLSIFIIRRYSEGFAQAAFEGNAAGAAAAIGFFPSGHSICRAADKYASFKKTIF